MALRREDLLFARTDGDKILTKKLRQEITLLKEGIDSFSQETDFNTNYSFFNKTVQVNISISELNNSESLDESQLTIEFIFQARKQVDSSDTPTSFTSVTTPGKITNFVAEVEDFLLSIM